MLKDAFASTSPYKKRARIFTVLWALLIFILCFLPGKEFPDVRIPLIDKWVHFLLFGVFSFLWLCSAPSTRLRALLIAFAAGTVLGWLVEEVQGLLVFLGRSKSLQDILADAIGAAAGVLVFYLCALGARKPDKSV